MVSWNIHLDLEVSVQNLSRELDKSFESIRCALYATRCHLDEALYMQNTFKD